MERALRMLYSVKAAGLQIGHATLGPSRSYEAVKQGEMSTDHVPVSFWKRAISHQPLRRLLVLAGTALVLMAMMILHSTGGSTEPFPDGVHRQQDHMLYVVMPSSEPNSEVCKSVLTAGILGYPTPVVISYNTTLDTLGRESEREQRKLEMLSGYFNRMAASSDTDIAVVLDTAYSWFQLRPEVLISRYYESNRKANHMLRKLFSADEVAFGGIKQEVVISVNGARAKSNQAVDDSLNVAALPVISMVVGPVGRLRALYRRAAAKADGALGDIDSQIILAEIFDQQELRREGIRQQYRSSKSRTWQNWHSVFRKSWSGDGGVEKVTNHELEADDGKDREFGIGLDYVNELGLVADHEYDAELSDLNNHAHVPEDIAASMPPYWTPSGNHSFVDKSWKEVPLVMGRDTKTVPVIVSFPRHDTDFRKAHWMDFWMQPGMKSLLEEALSVPRLPVASVLDATYTEHTFWDKSVRFDRAGLLTTEGGWAPWKDICDREDTWDLADTSESKSEI